MPFTVYDWYETKFEPEIKKAIKDEEKNGQKDYGFDRFVTALKKALNVDGMALDSIRRPLLMAILESDGERKDLPVLLEECFDIMNYGTDAVLNGVNYTQGSAINNNINYHINQCSECGEMIEDEE